jgi:hypothetical protein
LSQYLRDPKNVDAVSPMNADGKNRGAALWGKYVDENKAHRKPRRNLPLSLSSARNKERYSVLADAKNILDNFSLNRLSSCADNDITL